MLEIFMKVCSQAMLEIFMKVCSQAITSNL
nr:MAG TPA: protein of unknown function (DUF4607) [Caudoviricetes sp.]